MKKVFISYRREGAAHLAARIRDRLINKGYAVFFDLESMLSGSFNKQLYEKIESCDVFILVLPPKGLNSS